MTNKTLYSKHRDINAKDLQGRAARAPASEAEPLQLAQWRSDIGRRRAAREAALGIELNM